MPEALGNPPPASTHFLSTVRPDSRPHTVGVGAMYDDGDDRPEKVDSWASRRSSKTAGVIL